MPLYEYRCPRCNKTITLYRRVEDRPRTIYCEVCHTPACRVYSVNLSIFKPGWWEDIDVRPIWIESKKQLIEECEKRGLYAEYVWDEMHNCKEGGVNE